MENEDGERLAGEQRAPCDAPSEEASHQTDSERSGTPMEIASRWLSRQVDEADSFDVSGTVGSTRELPAFAAPDAAATTAAVTVAAAAATAAAAAAAATPPTAPATNEAAYSALLKQVAELQAESRWDEAEALLRQVLRQL